MTELEPLGELRTELEALTREANRLVAKYEPERLSRETLASIKAEVRDGQSGWNAISRAGSGPVDRSWSELLETFTDTLQAWRYNGWVRQVVRLTTAYVVGDGLTVSSTVAEVQQFIDKFWQHPENGMVLRLASWSDELCRAGEIFPTLFTNKYSGMSHVRAVPASCVPHIETDANDYEKELAYHESQVGTVEPKIWKSKRRAKVYKPDKLGRLRRPDPVMLHYAVNRPVGATRGESDLLPFLAWAQRYTDWLKGRVLFNRIRNLLAIMWVKINDENQVKDKQAEYESNPPGEGAVFVTGPDEEVSFPSARIEATSAEADGKAIRLAMAAASNLSLVHFGEGDTANLSTTTSMDDRTYRTYRQRQQALEFFVTDLVTVAYSRYREVTTGQPVADDEDLGITVSCPDISRSDNEALAKAAKEMVTGLAALRAALGLAGDKFDSIFLNLAFKFAGELLDEDDIKAILKERPDPQTNQPTNEPSNQQTNGDDDETNDDSDSAGEQHRAHHRFGVNGHATAEVEPT